ncbi:MAG: hypothetical protein ACKO9U_11850 [Dolichospermum sp.]
MTNSIVFFPKRSNCFYYSSELLAAVLRYRTPTPQKAIAPPHPPNSDRTPSSPTAIALSHPQTAISPPHPQTAITPHIPKQRFLRSASLSHPHIPQTAIPTERFAIALSHPKTAITPHIHKTAITPHIHKKRSHSHTPKSDRPSHPQTANCLQQRWRYRPPSSPKKAIAYQKISP